MEEPKCFIISGNTPSSKNNRVWTGKLFIASKQTMKWRKLTRKQWQDQRLSFINELVSLPKPYYIELTFFRMTKHRFDYINLAQGVMDEMNYWEWLLDDDANNVKPYFGDYQYDKENPRVEIRVLKQKPIHFPMENVVVRHPGI